MQSSDNCNNSFGYEADDGNKFSNSFKKQLYNEILAAGGFHRDIIKEVLDSKVDLYGVPGSSRRTKIRAVIQYLKNNPPTHKIGFLTPPRVEHLQSPPPSTGFSSPPRIEHLQSPPPSTPDIPLTMSKVLLDKFKPVGFPDSWIGMSVLSSCHVQIPNRCTDFISYLLF